MPRHWSVGTAQYMSPEQFAGNEADARSDVYSLGCVLYECLVGQVPFTGPNMMAIMARHTMEVVPSMRVVRPNCRCTRSALGVASGPRRVVDDMLPNAPHHQPSLANGPREPQAALAAVRRMRLLGRG